MQNPKSQAHRAAQPANGDRAGQGRIAVPPLGERAASARRYRQRRLSAFSCCWRSSPASSLFVGKQRFEAPGPLPQDRVVNIPHGSGMRDIADVLTREGVIDQPWVFIGGVMVLKAREDLKAGEYQFKAHASLRDVVATIVEGKVVRIRSAFPKGLTSEQIVARLMDDDVLTGNIKEIPPEGSLLPDTYNFTRGMTREQMIARMQQAQQRVAEGNLGSPFSRSAAQDAGPTRHTGFLGREGDRQAGRTHARRRGIRQPAETEHAAAVRSDHHLWAGGRQRHARPADHEERNRAADAVQHLS